MPILRSRLRSLLIVLLVLVVPVVRRFGGILAAYRPRLASANLCRISVVFPEKPAGI
jgi:hypothetical protein